MADATPTPPAEPTPPQPGWLARNWKTLLAYLITVAVSAGIGALTHQQVVPPPPPVFVEHPADPQPVACLPGQEMYGQGWVADPDAVQAVAAGLPQKLFADTPAGGITDIPKAVYGWQAHKQLTGQMPPVKNQGQVGSCVSFGTNTAVERTLAAEILRRGGNKDEWTRFTEEATYGGSRVEIGGGRIRGDGSVGAWAAKWFTEYGGVPRQKYPSTDLSTYSESRCRQWGDRGVPKEFEAIARTYPVKSFSQVKAWQDAKNAMAQDYFIAVCSNQGFTMQRDADGVCRPSGSWAHCMCLDGYVVTDSGKEYGHITNSWGSDAHTGPVGWGSPNPDGFWAESSVVDRMLKAGDSWAFSGVTGFPRRAPIDWFVNARPAVGQCVVIGAVREKDGRVRIPLFEHPELLNKVAADYALAP